MPAGITNKLIDFIVAFLFAAGIGIPLLGGMLLKDDMSSSMEKRKLTPLPDAPRTIKEIRRYPEMVDLYYQDNFGFRSIFLRGYTGAKLIIGDSPSEKVLLGKDGWLFYRGSTDDDLLNSTRGIRQYKVSELKQYADVLQARFNWLEQRGIKYMFVIAPNKHSIYREYLPEYMFQVKHKTITDGFVEYMRKHTSVPVIDLRQAILERKDSDTLLYFRTDTHWNHFGSSIAQHEIAKKLASFFPGKITPVSYERSRFKVRPGTGGGLSVLIGSREDFAEDYPKPQFDRCAKRPTPKDGNYQTTFRTACGKSDISAVIFRDSFFEWLHPYISLYLNKATYVWMQMDFASLKSFVERENPNVVIEEMVERTLTRIPRLEAEYYEQ